MAYKRVLTIQDISCVGQCSLTVALPILSACGLETAVLPSAVLSTHTGGFTGYTFRDLTDDMPKIEEHWKKENIKFDAVYTGYLGSSQQIDYVKSIMKSSVKDGGMKIVDPAMADNGKLYPGFDDDFVKAMRDLCADADYLLPNITEACLLCGYEYREDYDEEYIKNLLVSMTKICFGTIILTGIGYTFDSTGVVVYHNGEMQYYKHKKISKGCHGTGDIFASAFAGALIRGKTTIEATKIAADYTVSCIELTIKDEDHWYGAEFEPMLPKLIEAINE